MRNWMTPYEIAQDLRRRGYIEAAERYEAEHPIAKIPDIEAGRRLLAIEAAEAAGEATPPGAPSAPDVSDAKAASPDDAVVAGVKAAMDLATQREGRPRRPN